MKHIKFILGTLLAFQLTGCSDDVTGKYELPVSGDEIQFGAVSQGFSSQSRTVYGLPNGEDAHFGDYTYLTISWLPGQDHVRVYSDVESECQSADYVVQTTTDAGEVLVKDGDIGVRWGDVNKTHHFYSFYPTQRIIEGLHTDATVKANIPVAQEKGKLLMFDNDGKEITTGDAAPWKIIAPDMTYCMLAGKGTWNTGEEKNVALQYTPLVSVLDVVINGPSSDNSTSYNVVAVSVRSKTQNIVGDFTYDMKTEDFTYPTTSGDNKIATVSCIQGEGALSKPTTLHPGEKLNLKFFLLPQNINASELSISVLMEGGYVLTQNLSAEGGSTSANSDGILASGKISRVITPNIKEPNTNNWMSLIGDNVLFTSLSLPGTRFSYTSNIDVSKYNPTDGISQKYQSLRVADGEHSQFDAGIRAFDVDLIQKFSNLGNYQRLSGKPQVYSGISEIGFGLDYVLNALKAKVHPDNNVSYTEGVVLFLNYVNNGIHYDLWNQGVNDVITEWNESHPGVLQILTSGTIMKDMRGKIAIVVNLVGSDSSNLSSSLVNYISEYGTGRQNLNIRELTFNGNSGSKLYIQNLMQVNNPTFENINDEWSYGENKEGLLPYYITVDNSGEEDLMNVKVQLMNKMFELIKNDKGQSLFINDLSGFCVTKNRESTGSRQDPDKGNGGDSALFAKLFNLKATNAIAHMVNTGRVPMGIVFINFAGVSEVEFGSTTYQVQGIRIPGLIMSNNFLFDLPEKNN